MDLPCPTCGNAVRPHHRDCPSCGASLLLALVVAPEDSERSLPYERLLALSEATDPDWDELVAYLEAEREKYAGLGHLAEVEYMHGLQLMEQGLAGMLESVSELRSGGDWLDRAEEANSLLCQAQVHLCEAHELLEEPSAEES